MKKSTFCTKAAFADKTRISGRVLPKSFQQPVEKRLETGLFRVENRGVFNRRWKTLWKSALFLKYRLSRKCRIFGKAEITLDKSEKQYP